MRGVIVKPWDIPPSITSHHCVIQITEMDKEYSVHEMMGFLKDYYVKFCHTFGKNALITFINHNTAVKFLKEIPKTTFGLSANISFFRISYLENPIAAASSSFISRVICIQIIQLQVSLGIYDIYDECSKFGTVEKIICFEKGGNYALVQMHTVTEAALILTYLSNMYRYYPNFQFRISYSIKQDINIQYNNEKSFDFTLPGALATFNQLRRTNSADYSFFTPEHSDTVLEVLDLWRPVPIEEPGTKIIKVYGFPDHRVICDMLFNLFSQYGMVQKIKAIHKPINKAIVYMANQFSARMVVAYMQNCPFDVNKRLTLEYPCLGDQSDDNDYSTIIKDYTDKMIELDISEYSKMWPPSDTVSVEGVDASSLKIPLNCTYMADKNAIKFSSVINAVKFIAKRTDISNDVVLRFIV